MFKYFLFKTFGVYIWLHLIYILCLASLMWFYAYIWSILCLTGLMWIYIMFGRFDVVGMYNSFNHFSYLLAEFHTLDSVFGCWHFRKGTHSLAQGYVISFCMVMVFAWIMFFIFLFCCLNCESGPNIESYILSLVLNIYAYWVVKIHWWVKLVYKQCVQE